MCGIVSNPDTAAQPCKSTFILSRLSAHNEPRRPDGWFSPSCFQSDEDIRRVKTAQQVVDKNGRLG
jgi:hypothetical protein